MTEVIYEFNARNASPASPWNTNPANMVNGTETDYAETDDGGDEEELTGNECVGTDLGTISKVELRFYGYGDDNDEVVLTPVFGGSDDGDDHAVVPGVGAGWKAWQDISQDSNSPKVVYESNTVGDNSGIAFYDNGWKAQTFTPDSDHSIGYIRLKLYRGGSPGDLVVGIRATSDGKPTGPDLTSGTIDGNSLTTDSAGEWYVIPFGAYGLTASTQYAIVVRAPDGDISNYGAWRYDSSGAYADGAYVESVDSGQTWFAPTASDFMFEEGAWWAWSDVQNLDCDVEYDNSGKSNTMYVGMVQIQVTYEAAGATYNRTCTVTLSGPSLSLARVGTFARAPSRTGSVSMVLVRVGEFSRAPSRTGSVALALTKAVTFPRAVSRTGSTAQTLARVVTNLRAVSRTGSVSQTLARTGTFLRAISRTGSVSASAVFELVIQRAVSRAGSVATSLARSLTNLRSVSRTGSVSTSVTKAVTFARAVSRTGSVSVSLAVERVLSRATSRVGSVATSLARTLTNLRGVTRTGSVTTSLTKVATFARAISRVGSVAASVVATISLERAVSRTGSVATALDAILTYGRQVTRTGSVATSLARAGDFSRSVSRTGSVATSVARQLIEEGVEFVTGLYRRIIG